MKRHPGLIQFSREHHPALVLAKRAQSMDNVSPEACTRLIAKVIQVFGDDLEPHFCAEEERLLPALRSVGHAAIVDRTLAEHAELRRLVACLDVDNLSHFGKLLAAHVRFEERELFPLAETVLAPDVLAHLEKEQPVLPFKCSS